MADDGVDRTVGLLTEKDPVCDDWIRYANELADATLEWNEIDKTISAAGWSPAQRVIADRAAEAITSAANRFESILPRANNVVLQELIAQSIGYWRTFVDRIRAYVQPDSMLAGAAGNFGSAVTFMCTAVPIVVARSTATETFTSSTTDSADLTPFIYNSDPSCRNLVALLDRQNKVLRGWASGDPSVPASEWSADERRLNEAAIPMLREDAKQARLIANDSNNSVLSDIVRTYSAYVDAYVKLLPEYEPDDDQLWRVATFLGGGLGAACRAAL